MRALPAFLISAALLTATAAAAASACFGDGTAAQAAGVADARSVQLSDGRVLRPAGIESFALLVDDGDAAEAALQARLATLLAGRRLRYGALAEARDRYGRIPALIGTDDGRLVQELLAAEGLALAYATGEPLPCFAAVLAAEEAARQARRGFWRVARALPARPQALQPRIGRFAIFEGAVISVGNRRGRTYLNFGRRWSSDVTAAIAARHRAGFGGEAGLAALGGQRVRIRGFVEAWNGPLVAVASPMQVETLGRAAGDGEVP